MASVSFGVFSKRRNSTKQPTNELSDVRTVTLKEDCSQDRPIFKVTGNNFNYNYCSWDGKYYFIDEIISLRNNEIEVHCVMDPLATYKSYILAGTYFVSYSSQLGNTWLADTRLPVLKSTTAAKSTASMGSLFSDAGFYILTAVGKDGCGVYAMDLGKIKDLIAEVSNWSDDGIKDIVNDSMNLGYDFSTPESAIESLGKMMTQSGFLGNAYSQAPSCIRSCIWVPFFSSPFVDTGAELYLGAFDTGIHPFILKSGPVSGSTSVSIPWHFSDWRRGYCEDVYLYLPLVGMVGLASDNLTHVSSITIKYSATATDGCVCYQVIAGNEIIGSYGGQCSANYPIGISQQASAGQIAQTAFAGLEKTVNMAINSSVSPISAGAAVVGAGLAGTEAVYDLANVALSRNNSCIGGVGGGAGAGLDLNVTCYTVAHDTVISPSDMKDTMGLPTMKPLAIANLTGFCQLANAHVEAPATAGELDAIDSMINSGFFIE